MAFKFLLGITFLFAGTWFPRFELSINVNDAGTETQHSELKVQHKNEEVKPSCQSGKTVIYKSIKKIMCKTKLIEKVIHLHFVIFWKNEVKRVY